MALYLGLLIFSFIIASLVIIPVIDLLYKNASKTAFPSPPGGGVFIILLVTLLFGLLFPLLSRLGIYISTVFPLQEELNLIFFTFLSFGSLGLIDDLHRLFPPGLPFKISPIMRWVFKLTLSTIIAFTLYLNLNIHIINVPIFGVWHLGLLYIPLAIVFILGLSTAFSISDDIDGLSCGLLMVALLAFWGISVTFLDTPLSMFIALWLGAIIAFLYFNVYPARISLGEAGRMSFGATLAVVGLLLGKPIATIAVSGILIANLLSFLLFATPFHRLLLTRKWPIPKVSLRAWLAGIILAIIGFWLALF